MANNELDITPDPKVLIALTHTPLKPLDALCELIDNAIDSFRAARLDGQPEPHPLIRLEVPGEAEVRRGEGIVRVADNGAGLTRDGLEQALRVGFSGKNRYDSLGLFGMGFNIATGKLGQRTIVTTTQIGSDRALRVTLDLMQVVQNRSFVVPVEEIEKPRGMARGTLIEVDRWWPDGSANSGFITQLARISKPQLRSLIGRRYATLLRKDAEDTAQISVNQDRVTPFEHCVWSEERFVDRQGWGQICAKQTIDQILSTQERCKSDGALRPTSSEVCTECGGSEFTSIEERVHGWVGVQRYDDMNRFGIDLIRNGRAIRPEEKDAFFNYADEFGAVAKEYPIDGQYGRIVGEIHLDRVPVDFGKQDFQRSSEEWNRAIGFLRGGSLLPKNWNDGERNTAPVSKLFQGFRRVRNIGRQDMYMGRFDTTQNRAVRVSREQEQEYLQRFHEREPGFYDDARWWDLVELATMPPVAPLEECAACGYQGLPGAELCEGCTAILRAKECSECGKDVPESAVACVHCGASLIPVVLEPWTCRVCEAINEVDAEACATCSEVRGTPHPLDIERLRARSATDPNLCFSDQRFELAAGQSSAPLSVTTHLVESPLRPSWNSSGVAAVSFKQPGEIEVFIDPNHEAFRRNGFALADAVAIEAAQYVHDMNTQLKGKADHSVVNITQAIVRQVWGPELFAGPDQVREACVELFNQIAERIPLGDSAADYYSELDHFGERELADRLITHGRLDDLTTMKADGSYLRFSPPGLLNGFFHFAPRDWFGTVWNRSLQVADDVGAEAAATANDQLIGVVGRCLDDCAGYLRFSESSPLILTRVRAACDFLDEMLA